MACNQNIPTPIDQKSVYSFYNLTINRRDKDETVELNKILLDEMKDRVANQIAAVPTDRFRVMDDDQPPWHTLHIFRYLEKYGCVNISLPCSINLMGNWIDKSGWDLLTIKNAQGTRKEAILALPKVTMRRVQRFFNITWERRTDFVSIAKQWQANGVMIRLNGGCEGFACGLMDCRLALLEAGVPTITFEGNMADKREFGEAHTQRE